MHLRYETGIAGLIQFISLTLLGIPNALVSIIPTCSNDHTDCVSNLIVSLIFLLLTAAWFGFVWLIAYAAQERRSKRFAWLLIACEGATAVIALFNSRHDSNYLTKATSIIDLILALWIIILAFRLARAKGGRIVKSSRSRKRRHQPPSSPE
jgi:preprotein translocase subunit SecG